ncbi:zinc finger BED domain-containing protein RICESLEEPER 2 [Tanacetum coccineum]
MAQDILSVQATSVASKLAFSTSGRVLSIRRTRLALASLEMCMCLKDHLVITDRIQHTLNLENALEFEEGIFDEEVLANEAILLFEEIAVDEAASEASICLEDSKRGPTPVTENAYRTLQSGVSGYFHRSRWIFQTSLWTNIFTLKLKKLLGAVKVSTIVYKDALTSDPEISSEPTVNPNHINFEVSFFKSDDEDYTFLYNKDSFSYKLIFVNVLKSDKENNDDKIEIELSSKYISTKPMDSVIDYDVDNYSHTFDKNLETNRGTLQLQLGDHGGEPLNIDCGGPKRQQARAITISTHIDPKPAQEGGQADPTPSKRLHEEVHGLRRSFGEQHVVVDEMSRDFARFTTWVVGHLGQLLDASGVTYPRYDDSHVPY